MYKCLHFNMMFILLFNSFFFPFFFLFTLLQVVIKKRNYHKKTVQMFIYVFFATRLYTFMLLHLQHLLDLNVYLAIQETSGSAIIVLYCKVSGKCLL